MARFNKQKISEHKKFDTKNYEGAPAHLKTPEMELYSMACTSMVADQFYRSTDDALETLDGLLDKVDKTFAQKLAIYSREEMYLRSFPLVMAVLLAQKKKASKKFVERVIQRADELSEILATYQHFNDGKLKPMPNTIKDGVAEAFLKFDEYQLKKYKREDKDISLRDAMFLAHPKPAKEMEPVFKGLADKTLEPPYTWEVELSTAKEKGKTKKQVWEELIDSKKLGYMATLRNLRNFLQEEISMDHIKKVIEYISNPNAVRKSKQLPFRFLSAYRELKDVKSPDVHLFLDALESAINVSTENIPGFDGQTLLIASDVSGSMNCLISPRSSIENYDVGLVLSMLLQKVTRCYTGIFGDTYLGVQLPKKNILANTEHLHELNSEVGWSTNGYEVIRFLLENGIGVHKVMIFTDCQMWDSATFSHDRHIQQYWDQYKAKCPGAKLYLFDLAGYKDTPLKVNQKDVYLIAGFSDKIFGALDAIEKGSSVLDIINKVEI